MFGALAQPLITMEDSSLIKCSSIC